jgi:hypothetical protein
MDFEPLKPPSHQLDDESVAIDFQNPDDVHSQIELGEGWQNRVSRITRRRCYRPTGYD